MKSVYGMVSLDSQRIPSRCYDGRNTWEDSEQKCNEYGGLMLIHSSLKIIQIVLGWENVYTTLKMW